MRLASGLLLTLLVCIGLGRYLAGLLGLGPWSDWLFALSIPVLVCIAFAAIGQLVATRLDPDPARARGVAAIKVYLAELGDFLWCFVIAQPLLAWWMPLERHATQPRGVAVFVHGFMCNRGLWWRWRRRWHVAGWNTLVIDLPCLYWQPLHNLQLLGAQLAQLGRRHPHLPLLLIGHSMGGLLGRLQQSEREPALRGVISLGAPHRGTVLAGQFGGADRGPPTPESGWLADFLRRPTLPNGNLINVCSANDCIVVPAASSMLDPASDWQRPALGHMGLCQSIPLCLQLIDAAEKLVNSQRADPSQPTSSVASHSPSALPVGP